MALTYTLEPLVEYAYDAQNRVVKAVYANNVTETDRYDPNRD